MGVAEYTNPHQTTRERYNMREVKWANPELIKGIGVITPPRHVSANPNADEYGSWSRGMKGRTFGVANGQPWDTPDTSPAVRVTKNAEVRGHSYVNGRWVSGVTQVAPRTEIKSARGFGKTRSSTHRTSKTRTTAVAAPEVMRLPSIHIGADDDN